MTSEFDHDLFSVANLERPRKVVAYIVRDGRVLVFRHADDISVDESGIQLPAGSIKEGEQPEEAVLREAYEETGLARLRIVRYLGTSAYDMRPYASAVHIRHYFHLSVDADNVPHRWLHSEHGDGTSPPVRFALYWLPLAQAHVVAAGQAALLGRLYDWPGTADTERLTSRCQNGDRLPPASSPQP